MKAVPVSIIICLWVQLSNNTPPNLFLSMSVYVVNFLDSNENHFILWKLRQRLEEAAYFTGINRFSLLSNNMLLMESPICSFLFLFYYYKWKEMNYHLFFLLQIEDHEKNREEGSFVWYSTLCMNICDFSPLKLKFAFEIFKIYLMIRLWMFMSITFITYFY